MFQEAYKKAYDLTTHLLQLRVVEDDFDNSKDVLERCESQKRELAIRIFKEASDKKKVEALKIRLEELNRYIEKLKEGKEKFVEESRRKILSRIKEIEDAVQSYQGV